MKRSFGAIFLGLGPGLGLGLCGCVPGGSAKIASEPLQTGAPRLFNALGTEPFWAAKVDGGVLLYQTPEDLAGQRVAVIRRVSGLRTEFSGTLGGAPLTLVIGAGPCSDGMSDTVYSHSAELRIGAQDLRGCAKARQ